MIPKPTRTLAAALLLLAPAAARAFLGVGDIVYDPTETAQTVNLLRQAQQEFDRLGTLLGVSTRQLDQLVGLAAAIGNPGSEPFSSRLPDPAAWAEAVHSVPGLGNADLKALFDTSGLLDAFMGVPLESWTEAIENPASFLRTALVEPAIERVGSAAGASEPAGSYAQWFSSRTTEDQANIEARASVDFSALLGADWLGQARLRRVNLLGLAAAERDAEDRAARAGTMAELARAHAQLGASAGAILLETAAQNAGAAEAGVAAVHAQNRLLAEESEARRDEAEMRLDCPP